MNHPAKVLGEELSAARKAKGLSLEDVSRATKIRKPILLALEEGRLEDLPPAVFLAGHLRAYAAVLELDGEPYVERLRQLTCAPPAERRSEEAPAAHRFRVRPVLLAVLLVILAAGGAGWVWVHYGEGGKRRAPEGASLAGGPREPSPSPPAAVPETPHMGQAKEGGATPTKQAAPETAVQAAPSPRAPATVPETSVEAPVKPASEPAVSTGAEPAAATTPAETPAAVPVAQGDLVIVCSKPCWLALWADGQRKIYRQLRAGETVALNGKRFRADIGDPSALSITFQGRSVALPGAPGKPLKNFQIPSETQPQTP
ncbi:MAG: helix-turn-helix domain-containing protein [Acidobacteriota bacterium]